MPELDSPKYERLALFLSQGMSAHEAYRQAGFRPDRSNAAKASKRPDVVARVQEMIAAEEQRLAQARGDGVTKTGEQLLRMAAQKALASNNLVALVQAGKQIGEADGSLDALASGAANAPSSAEIIRELDKFGPVEGLVGRMLYSPTNFKRPAADDADIAIAEAGLSRWFSAEQLQTLGRRLIATK